MRHKILSTMILVLGLVAMATIATAQQPQVIHFQGLLVGPDGGPLQTDIYDVNFSIWDQEAGGTEALWSEIQMVETTNGLFDVFLGSVDALSPDVFTPFDGEDIGLRYLEIEVIGDEPMTPRIQMGKTPTSFISSRVLGDIVTGAGSFKMAHPLEGPSFELSSDGISDQISMKMGHPPEGPSFELSSDGINDQISMRMGHPPEVPAIEMMADASGSSFKVNLAEPPDEKPGVEIMTSNIGPAGSQASFRMFNPQPEPPADPLLEMNTTEFGANFAMAAPQAGGLGTDITDPMFEIITDSNGGAINLYDEIGKVMGLEPMPFTPGGRFQMYDPIADAVKFEVEATEDGASMDIYDEIGKVMSFEPSPFTPGGFLYLIDPTADDTTILISSAGDITAKRGNFGDSNINSGGDAFVIGRNNSVSGNFSFAGGQDALANHSGCFVFGDGAGSPYYQLSTDASNQFLVRSTGGVAFYSNSQLTYGVSLGPGDYSWNSILPALTARNSRDVDGSDILNKIEQLPIRQFTVEGEDNQIKHISPVPEDFNRLFGVGEDDNHISMLDPSGVALAGVQALLDKIEKLEARIAELEAERR